LGVCLFVLDAPWCRPGNDGYRHPSTYGLFIKFKGYFPAIKADILFKILSYLHILKRAVINSDLKLSGRLWTCPGCGSFLDRDINAALNILEEAASGAAGI